MKYMTDTPVNFDVNVIYYDDKFKIRRMNRMLRCKLKK